MLEAIIEFIFSIVIEILIWGIIAFPGAFVIWFARGQKDSFKSIVDQKLFSSILIGIVIWSLFIWAFFKFIGA